MTEVYSLRSATADDYQFLYNLVVVCLKEYVTATWGWDEAHQRRHFASHFDPSRIQIVMVDNRDIGQLSLVDRGHEFYIATIYILPDFQNQGIGTAIVKDALEAAIRKGVRVSLQVIKVNPARALYERLGFRVVLETDTHYVMAHEGIGSIESI